MGRRGGWLDQTLIVKSDPEFMAPVNFYAGKGCIFYAFFMTCAVPVIGNYSLKVTKRSN